MAGTATRRALVVDDEVALAKVVAAYLERDGFSVEVVGDGPSALAEARRLDPDLVVLDLGLPGLDGLEVCRRLREFSDCYVLMLTARAGETDTLRGLESGADDYVAKPFSPREVAARAQVLLRRPRRPSRPERIALEDLLIDRARHETSRDGELIPLTRTELDLLLALVDQPGAALSRRQLLDVVWGRHWVGDDHLVDVHVAAVRRKLGRRPDGAHYIDTVRGVGYRLRGGS